MRIASFLPFAAALSFASGALISAPARSAVETVEPAASDAEDDPIDLFMGLFSARDYKEALKFASELDLADTKEGKALKQSLRAMAFLGLGKKEEAQRLFAEADRAWPTKPLLSQLQLEAALRTQQMDIAHSSFDTMIARFPDRVRDIPDKTVWYLLREEPKGF